MKQKLLLAIPFRALGGKAGALMLAIGISGNIQALTYMVTNSDDSGVGSLRQAILDANATTNVFDYIGFAIPWSGLHTIIPTSNLPIITDSVTIDGYSQEGASANTLAYGNDAVLVVQLNGSSTGQGNGLEIIADGVTVQGLVINRFKNAGIRVTGGADTTRILGNYIGTDQTGTAKLSMMDVGISISEAHNSIIGGTSPAMRNVVSGNRTQGIWLADVDHTQILGNFIGLGSDGSTDLGNGRHGIFIDGDENSVGDGTEAGSNRIAYNGKGGISIAEFITSQHPAGNAIRRNNIFMNKMGLGIDLRPDGVTANDAVLDGDAGVNGLQNFPELTMADKVAGPGTRVQGQLRSEPNAIFVIEIYGNAIRDPSGHGEGEFFLGDFIVATDGGGLALFDTTVAASPGAWISSTATHLGTTNTSEFSGVVPVNGQTYEVSNVNDSGAGSLRDAIGQVNSNTEVAVVNKITFDIPGPGPHVINVASPQLVVNQPLSILGSTQPGLDEGIPRIELRSLVGVGGALINLDASGCSLENISISANNGGTCVGSLGDNDLSFEGCHLGVDAAGTTGGGCSDILVVNAATGFRFADCVIGGSLFDGGTIIGSEDGCIESNTIGLDPLGGNIGIGGTGLLLDNCQYFNVRDNTIANNFYEGILLYPGSIFIQISRNSIFNNGLLGSDAFPFGPGLNDPMDADSGINAGQNHPELDGSAVSPERISIVGKLHSAPNEEYTVEFFQSTSGDLSGYGEGEFYINSETITTDENGDGFFDVAFPNEHPGARVVTATATDRLGNTSEFSPFRDSLDLPLITGFERDAILGEVTFDSDPSGEYFLRRRTDLTADPGVIIQDGIMGTGGPITVNFTNSPLPEAFFDIILDFNPTPP